MAIRYKPNIDLKMFKLIAKIDDALDEGSDHDKYIETGDESHLKLKATPTYFILNLDLKKAEAERIKNSMTSSKDDEGRPSVSMGSWQFAVTKAVLKDIVNPSDLPLEEHLVFKKSGLGFPTDDLLATLDRLGIAADIFGVYTQHVLKSSRSEAKN